MQSSGESELLVEQRFLRAKAEIQIRSELVQFNAGAETKQFRGPE